MLNAAITLVGYSALTDGIESLLSMNTLYGIVLWTAIEHIVRIAGLEVLDAMERRAEKRALDRRPKSTAERIRMRIVTDRAANAKFTRR